MKTKKPLFWLRTLAMVLPPKKKSKKKIISSGNHHNLNELFEEINETYFSKSLDLRVNWSGNGSSSSLRSIRLGSYNLKTQNIKINKILDYPHIPKYFVSFILYHEILHHLYPPLCSFGSRRKIHHPLFKRKEKEFQEYEKAQNFLKELKKTLFAPKISIKDNS